MFVTDCYRSCGDESLDRGGIPEYRCTLNWAGSPPPLRIDPSYPSNKSRIGTPGNPMITRLLLASSVISESKGKQWFTAVVSRHPRLPDSRPRLRDTRTALLVRDNPPIEGKEPASADLSACGESERQMVKVSLDKTEDNEERSHRILRPADWCCLLARGAWTEC